MIALWALVVLYAQPSGSRSRLTEVGPFDAGSPVRFTRSRGWNLQGDRRLMKTNDGGKSWVPVRTPEIGDGNIKIRGAYFFSDTKAWVFLAPMADRIDIQELETPFETVDGGSTWTAQTPMPRGWNLHAMSAVGESAWLGGQETMPATEVPPSNECDQKLIGLGQLWTPVVYYKRGGNAPWRRQLFPIATGCPISVLHFSNETHGIAVSGTTVFYTEDAGVHWKESGLEVVGDRTSWHQKTLALDNLFFLEGSRQIAWLSNDGDLLKTTDGGRKWRQIVRRRHSWPSGVGFGRWGAVYFVTEKRGWTLGGDGEVFETLDGGMKWSKVEAPERMIDLSGAEGTCWVIAPDRLYEIITGY